MNKRYACTDLHGVYNLWDQIKHFCDSNDQIYFLGDAIDRGDEGLRIMNEMLCDDRVIYIKGNHEDIMLRAATDLMEGRGWSNEILLWLRNGGSPTISDFKHQPEATQMWLLKKINEMPEYVIMTNAKGDTLLLTHAGIDPWDFDDRKPDKYGNSPLIWDRNHFYHEWKSSPQWSHTYVVHGHTPCSNLMKKLNEFDRFNEQPPRYDLDRWGYTIVRYADGHKIDLDLGSFKTSRAALLDLDTLEVAHYFYDKDIDLS